MKQFTFHIGYEQYITYITSKYCQQSVVALCVYQTLCAVRLDGLNKLVIVNTDCSLRHRCYVQEGAAFIQQLKATPVDHSLLKFTQSNVK
jgi:hypothetical protein